MNPLMDSLIAGGQAIGRSAEPGFYTAKAMEMSAATALAEERARGLAAQQAALAAQDRRSLNAIAGAAGAFTAMPAVNRTMMLVGYATTAYAGYRLMSWLGTLGGGRRRR